MSERDLEGRLRRVAWPMPPADLRARVLRDAPVGSVPIAWSDRLWFSRTWRVSMVAATLALLVFGQLAGAPPQSTRATAPMPFAGDRAIEETARQIGLPSELVARLLSEATPSRDERAVDPGDWVPLADMLAEGGR